MRSPRRANGPRAARALFGAERDVEHQRAENAAESIDGAKRPPQGLEERRHEMEPPHRRHLQAGASTVVLSSRHPTQFSRPS